MEEEKEETASSILGFTPERKDFLIGFLGECFEAGVVREESSNGLSVDATKMVKRVEEEQDITRIEGLWIAFKLGEACGNKKAGYMLHVFNRVEKTQEEK